ncbi:MAG TPA: 2-dehydropantoate 2-reductase [Moraxellaceae bacterium]|nr:2-dehydropantoate 2-reductase [Moraxellaceae bacterium]
MSRIAVFGAGSIGCYIGGRLAVAGHDVTFIGRPYQAEALAAHGLTVSDYRGYRSRLTPAEVTFRTDAAAAATADLVLITVKSGAIETAAQALAPLLRHDALVISLQNGLHNVEPLRDALPRHTVLAGMVPFNVMQPGPGHFHQGSEGMLQVQQSPRLDPFLNAFQSAGLPLVRVDNIVAVQWAKLLLNLNNAVNGLSGLPLRAELEQRAYRQVLAAAQREALALLKRRKQPLAKLTPLPAAWLPPLLELPDSFFRRFAHRLLAIDPLARSSLQDDLAAGRRTEIEWLQGEIVKMAEAEGQSAPVNRRLMELVQAAELGGRRNWSGPELLNAVRAAR